MALSMVEVAGLAYDAGLRSPASIAQATAIATAESGRDPGKLGDTGRAGEKTTDGRHWGPSVGLWQVRSIQEEKGKGTTRDADKLRDPAANARAMVEISGSGKTWVPWSVINPVKDPAGFLRYQGALPLAYKAAADALAAKGLGKAVDAAANAASIALDPVEKLAKTISESVQTPARIINWLTEGGTWVRIALFVGGGVLLVAGLGQVVRSTTMNQATKVVQTVLPTGKVGKLMKGAK